MSTPKPTPGTSHRGPSTGGSSAAEPSAAEVAAFTARLRELSHAITTGTDRPGEVEAFIADRDALLAGLPGPHTTRTYPEAQEAAVSDHDARSQATAPGAPAGRYATPVPDHELVSGWIVLPGGLPPDDDELDDTGPDPAAGGVAAGAARGSGPWAGLPEADRERLVEALGPDDQSEWARLREATDPAVDPGTTRERFAAIETRALSGLSTAELLTAGRSPDGDDGEAWVAADGDVEAVGEVDRARASCQAAREAASRAVAHAREASTDPSPPPLGTAHDDGRDAGYETSRGDAEAHTDGGGLG